LLRKGVAQVAAELGVEPMQIQLYKIGGSSYDKQYKARRCSPPAVASPDVGLCKARRWPKQLRHGYSLPQQLLDCGQLRACNRTLASKWCARVGFQERGGAVLRIARTLCCVRVSGS